jgi:hypothetical protein
MNLPEPFRDDSTFTLTALAVTLLGFGAMGLAWRANKEAEKAEAAPFYRDPNPTRLQELPSWADAERNWHEGSEGPTRLNALFGPEEHPHGLSAHYIQSMASMALDLQDTYRLSRLLTGHARHNSANLAETQDLINRVREAGYTTIVDQFDHQLDLLGGTWKPWTK